MAAVTVLLLAAPLIPPPPPAAADGTSVLVDERVATMTLSGPRLLYGSQLDGSGMRCLGEEFPDVCRIRYVSADDDPRPVTDWMPSTTARGTIASNLAANSDYLYWVDTLGDVRRMPIAAAGYGTEVVAPLEDPATAGIVSAVTADELYVYWTENQPGGGGRLYRSRGPAFGAELMVDNPDGHIRQPQADGRGAVVYVTDRSHGFLCCDDALEQVTPIDGRFRIDSGDTPGVHAFAMEGAYVYFIARSWGRSPEVRRAVVGNISADTRVRVLDGTDDPSFPSMAARDGMLYWQEYRSPAGPIMRMTTAGTDREAITGNLDSAAQLLVNDTHLFARVGGAIHRIAVDAAGSVLDIDGDDLRPEVVQVIQGEDHDVRLVAGKRTLVRVYGRLSSADPGQAELVLPPPVVLHGTAADGSPLPLSPLRPIRVQPIPAAAEVDRTDLDTTFLFQLPETWTQGTVTLRSSFNDARAVPELDLSNNGATRTVPFEETVGVCLDILPVQTHAGVSEIAPSPGLTPHFTRGLSMLPTDRVYPIWRGGEPRTMPVIGDHYNMRDVDHKNLLFSNLNSELGHQDPPAACGDDRLVRTAIVPDSDTGGRMAGIGPYIYVWRRDGAGATPADSPAGGISLVHELGHVFAMAHVRCPTGDDAPGWPHESFPYDSCQLDDRNDHIGLDVVSRDLIVPLVADTTGALRPGPRDVMAYPDGRPRWTSDYTYDKIFRQLVVGGTVEASVAGSDAPADASEPDPTSVVAGFIPPDGDAFLGYAATAWGPPLTALLDRLDEPDMERSTEHELWVYDDEGALLATGPMHVTHTIQEQAGLDEEEVTLEFIGLVDDDLPAARLDVVETDTGTVLASRDGGVSAPTVRVDSPAAGDVVGERLHVRWRSADGDGDDVAHLVRYSNDGGATWSVLASNLVGTELDLDTTLLPGGDESYLEVITSDGVRSTSATVGPFVLPTHAPQVQILDEDLAPVDETATVTIRQSETLELHGSGYDAEDGQLFDDVLRWELTGPVVRTDSGERLSTHDLPPGRYEVTLTGTDADGNVSSAHTSLTVRAKRVAGATAPDLDGSCTDAAYAEDDDPLWLTASDGALVAGTLVHAGGVLYACFSGLVDDDASSQLTLHLDGDNSGGSVVGSDDLVLRVDRDGLRSLGRGDGSGGEVAVADPLGLRTAVAGLDGRWSAELRMDGEVLGPFGPLLRVRASSGSADAVTERAAWPVDSTGGAPDSWGLATMGDGPPELVMPDDITAQADSVDGAVVDYEVTATDDEDAEPAVTCEPASGSRFAIGSTIVTCRATDAAGNEAIGSFRVTVESTTFTDKQSIAHELAALLPSGDDEVDRAVGAAVDHLGDALEPSHWIDGHRLDVATGKDVFDAEKAAVDALRDLPDPPTTVVAAIEAMTLVDLALAETAIDDARGAIVAHADGDRRELEKAERELQRALEEMERAREDRDRGKHAQAIIRYRQAWQYAQAATARAQRSASP